MLRYNRADSLNFKIKNTVFGRISHETEFVEYIPCILKRKFIYYIHIDLIKRTLFKKIWRILLSKLLNIVFSFYFIIICLKTVYEVENISYINNN